MNKFHYSPSANGEIDNMPVNVRLEDLAPNKRHTIIWTKAGLDPCCVYFRHSTTMCQPRFCLDKRNIGEALHSKKTVCYNMPLISFCHDFSFVITELSLRDQ